MSQKQSNSWQKVKLADICSLLTDGKHGDCQNQEGSGYYFLSAKNIINGKLCYENAREITEEDFQETHKRTQLEPNDILMSNSGSIGKLAIADNSALTYKTTFQKSVAIIKPKHNLISNKFLYLYLLFAKKLFTQSITGTAQKNLLLRDLRNFQIPLPPLEEQRRIAAILDKADTVRRKREKAIRLTEELLRSLFLDMFGDPVTNPKGWEVVKLCEILAFLTSGSRGWAKYYALEGNLFLRIQNVKGGKLLLDDVAYVNPPDSTEAKRTCITEGDILLSITADLGRTAVVPKGLPTAYINQHLAIIRIDKNRVSPTYVSAFLSSVGGQLQFARLNREGVKAGLNFDDIRNLKIPLPPKEIQFKYESCFQLLNNMANIHRKDFEYSNKLFNSLLQKAFRGKL
ncbi:MAG: restriction endonuclease subunit S [Cyanobacteria bacterium P01_D01_bin.116]